MADLETAVAAALVRVKHLGEEADDAGEVLQDLDSRLSATSAQIDAEGSALREELRAFLQRVLAQRDALDREGQGASSAVDEEGAARDLAAEAEAVRDELERAMADAVGVAGQLAHDMEAAREQLEDGVHAIEQDMTEHLPQVLQEKFENWLDTLNEVERIVDESFEEAGHHLTDVVDYSLLECATQHLQSVEDLEPLVEALEQAAERLGEAIREHEADLAQARHIQHDCLADTDSGLQTMTTALERVRALLARFSFVGA